MHAGLISGTGPATNNYESGQGREIMSSEFRHVCYSQLSPSSIYKFGTGVSWESNRRSGVALAMRNMQAIVVLPPTGSRPWEGR